MQDLKIYEVHYLAAFLQLSSLRSIAVLLSGISLREYEALCLCRCRRFHCGLGRNGAPAMADVRLNSIDHQLLRIPSNSNGTIACTRLGTFCAGDSGATNIIVHCDQVGSQGNYAGNCNDNLAGVCGGGEIFVSCTKSS